MSVVDQLKALSRQFPRSRQLVVTREMAQEFECEMAECLRFTDATAPQRQWEAERVGHLIVQPLGLLFKAAHLVTVTHA